MRALASPAASGRFAAEVSGAVTPVTGALKALTNLEVVLLLLLKVVVCHESQAKVLPLVFPFWSLLARQKMFPPNSISLSHCL